MTLQVPLLDRYVLRRCGPALVVAFVAQSAAALLLGPVGGVVTATFVLVAGLGIVYFVLARDGEYLGFAAAGIAPRRIAAPAVVAVAAFELLFVIVACAFAHPRVPSAYVGYVLSAVQPVIATSSILPLAVRSRTDEPWKRVVLLLAAYIADMIAATLLTDSEHVGEGLSWVFATPPLVVADALLFRALGRPPS